MARLVRTLMRLSVVLVVASSLVGAVLVGLAYSANRLVHDVGTAKEQPLPNLITAAQLPSVIYASNGTVLATLRSSLYRQPVKLSKVAPILVKAVLDTEDHAFFVHGGFDVESIARALSADLSAGSAVQGGSTIAQQLVKNVYVGNQKTLSRKVREAVLADRLEQKYTKDQILDAYLNTIYLGSGAYGVEAASREYFGKSASRVDVAQAALIAGLIQAPSAYDPVTDPLAARERRSEVLARMVHYGTITQAQATVANETPLPTRVTGSPVSYTTRGWYVQEVVRELLDNPALGATYDQRVHALFEGGLKIYTNEVPALENVAQQAALQGVPSSLPGVVSAFAVIDPRNGDVEALVGGKPNGNFDDATEGAGRQAGSGFKLFTLIGALEEGYNVSDSILAASPCAILFPGNNYYGLHPMNNDPGDPSGVVTLVQATAMSINCAYLRLVHEVTLTKLVQVAHSMGISQFLPTNEPSLVLGTHGVYPIEMTAAYATVADGGIYHTPNMVNHILNQDGDVVYNGESKGRRVFSAVIADEALQALTATVQYGTGTSAALPTAAVAGKTGTTENSDDAWFNGITPTFAASVWMGYQQGELPMYVGWNGLACPYPPTELLALQEHCSEVFGAQYPALIWKAVAQYALQKTPYIAWPTTPWYDLPPIKYIISPSLEQDDLTFHDYPPAPPPAPTATAPAAPAKSTTTAPAPPSSTPVNSSPPGGPGPHQHP